MEANDEELPDFKRARRQTTLQYEQRTPSSRQPQKVTSWIKSQLHIFYKPTGSLITEPPPASSPSLTNQETAQVLNNLFTDDRGSRIDLGLGGEQDPPTIQPNNSPLALARTITTQSTISIDGVPESDFPSKRLMLDELVELIRSHTSLQDVKILSTEGYKLMSNAILHRFLVLELRGEEDSASVWLRIDRRVHPDSKGVSFVLALGQSPAYDTAIFSTDKAALVGRAQFETRQRFKDPKTLGEFKDILEVIRKELVAYQLWPANCWFFVSLLQQHLQGDEIGSFVDGSPKWGGTAQEIRFGVKQRLRLMYQVPLHISTQNVLVSLKAVPDPTIQALVSKALGHTEWISSNDMRQVGASSNSGFQTADTLHQIADRLLVSGRSENEMCLRQRAVDIAGELCRRDPRQYQRQLASYLRSLGDVLHQLGHSHVALRFLNEAVSLWRSVYKGDRNRSIIIIAWKQTRNAIKTVIRNAVSNLSQTIHISAPVVRARNQPLQASLQVSSNFASSLFTLAVVLHDTKRFNDACSAETEEVLIHRELYILHPEQHRVKLSKSLYSSSVSLEAAGRVHAAAGCVQEAVVLRRDLYNADPDPHRADLSQYLDNLGNSLYSLGHFSEAYTAKEEALTLRRELFKADPNPHQANLSSSLYNLGISLNSLGRFSKAYAANKEAVTLQQELFKADPGPRQANLSSYLDNLGISLNSLGRFSEAYAAQKGAVTLRRELFKADPNPHQADLSNYLDNLGNSLHSLGHFSEAYAAKKEAVTLQRELFKADPNPHQADLSRCLSNFGNSLYSLGRFSEAYAAKEEAVTLRRELFVADPDQHSADLSNYLNNLGISLDSLGRFSEAYAAKKEAVTLQRELFKADPNPHQADLSRCLNNLGISLNSLGRFSKACAAGEEAVTLRRELFEADPDPHCAHLSSCLTNLGCSLETLGRFSEAYAAKKEAVTLQQELFVADPDPHRADLSRCLYNLGISLNSLGRFSKACAAGEEAVTLRRELFEADPDLHCAHLSSCLNNLGSSLHSLGRFTEAWTALKEAVTLRQELFNADPNPHRVNLSLYLDNLRISLNSLGRLSEARAVENEALMLRDNSAVIRTELSHVSQ